MQINTTAPPLVKTRFLILSDTHSALPSQNASSTSPFRPPLPTADVALHCGDLTMLGHMDEYHRALSLLESIDAQLKLVIAGNHDISLDEKFYQRRGREMQGRRWEEDLPQRARGFWMGERAKRAGVVYLEEGTHWFRLGNGARLGVWASPYQPEFCDFAFPYARNEDRYNPPHQCSPYALPIAENPVPDWQPRGIDVVMTHGPPMGILDTIRDGTHVGCENLLRAMRRCRPRLHCFGHIHEGWGAQRVMWKEGLKSDGQELDGQTPMGWFERTEGVEVDEKRMRDERGVFLDVSGDGGKEVRWVSETLMVNASIMSVGYEPVQGPWVVDLDLEKAEGGAAQSSH